MNMQEFNATFPMLASNEPARRLSKFIGRKVRFNGYQPSDGEIHRYGLFEVIGVQRDWNGRLCLRVKCIQFRGKPFDDKFGCVMQTDRLAFATPVRKVRK